MLDRAAVLEAADPVEVPSGRGRTPSRLRMRGDTGEARIVAGEKAGEHPGGLGERAGVRETEFDHEAILESAEETLDPTFSFRRMGPDPFDAQFAERPPDLGLAWGAAELLVEGERDAGIGAKNAVAIGVHGRGEAVAADEMAEQQEVAVRIFLETEDGPEHAARGIIDRGEEDEAGAAVLQPGVVTTIELDEEARLRHALSSAAMAWGAAGAGTAQAGRA